MAFRLEVQERNHLQYMIAVLAKKTIHDHIVLTHLLNQTVVKSIVLQELQDLILLLVCDTLRMRRRDDVERQKMSRQSSRNSRKSDMKWGEWKEMQDNGGRERDRETESERERQKVREWPKVDWARSAPAVCRAPLAVLQSDSKAWQRS